MFAANSSNLLFVTE